MGVVGGGEEGEEGGMRFFFLCCQGVSLGRRDGEGREIPGCGVSSRARRRGTA